MCEQVQAKHVNITAIKGLSIEGQFVNDYLFLEMRFKLTGIAVADLPLSIKKKIRQGIKVIACRNLSALKGKSRLYIKTILKLRY